MGKSETLTKIVSYSPETIEALGDIARELAQARSELNRIGDEIERLVSEIKETLRAEVTRASGFELEVEPPLRFPRGDATGRDDGDEPQAA